MMSSYCHGEEDEGEKKEEAKMEHCGRRVACDVVVVVEGRQTVKACNDYVRPRRVA